MPAPFLFRGFGGDSADAFALAILFRLAPAQPGLHPVEIEIDERGGEER